MNQGTQGYSLMKKNQGSKISSHCLFKSKLYYANYLKMFKIAFCIAIECQVKNARCKTGFSYLHEVASPRLQICIRIEEVR
jgi:hypothetical protein